MERQKKLRGMVCAMISGGCWGFGGTVGQYLFTRKGIDSDWLTVVRLLCAGAILFAFSLVRYRSKVRALWSERRSALRLAVFALCGLMPCQYTYLTAIRHSNSATATVLQYTGQALVLLWVCLRAKRRPTLREAAGLALVLCGAFLLATHGSFTSLVLSPQALFWGLAAALSLMLYTLLPGDLLTRYEPSVCTGSGMLLGGLALFFLTRAWRISAAPDAAALLGIAAVIVVGTLLPFTLYLQGVREIGGVKASMLSSTELICAALVSALWLGTDYAAADIVGIVCVLLMAVLFALPDRKRTQGAPEA